MLAHALQYAAHGWQVFPLHTVRGGACSCGRSCDSPGKHPRVKGGFKTATIDPAQIGAWWAKWPYANIGIATGAISGLVVIDIDGPEGLAMLQGLVVQHGPLPRAPTVKTARGWHHYFKPLASGIAIPCRAGGGLDVRGDGGYVVAPPSVHATGHVYRWCDDAAGLQLAEVPDWLCEEPRQRTPAKWASDALELALGPRPAWLPPLAADASTRPRVRALAGLGETTDWSPADETRLRSALSAIPSINRDDWLHVGMALHEGGWPNAFELWTAWSRTCPEKYDEADQQRTWESFRGQRSGARITVATIFHLANVRGWTDDYVPDAHRNEPEKPEFKDAPNGGNGIATANWRNSIISAADLRTMRFAPIRYVLPQFIPEGMTLLVGRPKVGKSWWVLDLCLACVEDRPIFGTLKPVQGDVLYLALEDGKRRLQRRLDKLLGTLNSEWPEPLKLVPMGQWRRADQGGLDDIAAWCKSVPKPVLVVVDTLERIRKPTTGKTSLYSADYEAITGLQKIATDHSLAIIVLHHDRKSEADDAFDTVSGTLGLTGAADTILIMKRRSSGVILYARGRDIEESETAMQFDRDTCRWTILGAASEVHRSNERARVFAALNAAGQPLSAKEIMIAADMRNRNATDILLGKMAKDGEIQRVGRGRYDLSNKIAGQNGQKERLDSKTIDSVDESRNLSNLSDLSVTGDRTETNGHNGGSRGKPDRRRAERVAGSGHG